MGQYSSSVTLHSRLHAGLSRRTPRSTKPLFPRSQRCGERLGTYPALPDRRRPLSVFVRLDICVLCAKQSRRLRRHGAFDQHSSVIFEWSDAMRQMSLGTVIVFVMVLVLPRV